MNVYIKLAESRGISADQLLAGTNISSGDLRSSDGFITRESYYAVILNLLKLSKSTGIAFSLAEVVDISDLGIVGYAMLSSSTLGQAVSIRRQYLNNLYSSQIKIETVRDTKPGYELSFSSLSVNEIIRRFEIEEFLVEGAQYIKILTGKLPIYKNLSLPYSKPAHFKLYESFFDCPIQFDTPQAKLRTTSPDLSARVPSGNAEFHKVCAKHCQQVMRALHNDDLWKLRIRDVFLTTPGNLPALPVVAASMGVSERNLRRQLLLKGLSYRTLKQEFRLDLSRELLTFGRMAPKEVAHFLGYSTPSGLARAFKQWTGQTTRQFRKSAQRNHSR